MCKFWRCIPVGNYAVRLVFDDMHSTGIFSWDYLFELGQNREDYWRAYLGELAEQEAVARAASAVTCRIRMLRTAAKL